MITQRTAPLVLALAVPLVILAASNARVIQTNSAGDNVHVIDPANNQVTGVIQGIEVPHGVVLAPDGNRIYVTEESTGTLDVVDAKSLKVTKKIPLSGRPNNLVSVERRPPCLRGHRASARRGGCDRYCRAHEGKEHSRGWRYT